MAAAIDEHVAWKLVMALSPGSVQGDGSTRIDWPDEGDAAHVDWLDVDSTGSWKASRPVTDRARDVFDIYLPIRLPSDFVIGQLGQSLDGRIATEGGASHFVTGPDDIQRLHRVRALVDAVIVGAKTVEADDPRLTVRHVEGPSPVRVILDPRGRLGPDRKVFSDGAARTIVARLLSDVPGPPSGLQGAVAEDEILLAADPSGELNLPALLEALGAQGLRRVLVEGGGVTVSRFLQAGTLDRLHVSVAPLIIGSGRPSFTLDPITTLDDALRPDCRHFPLGQDVLFDFDLRRSSS